MAPIPSIGKINAVKNIASAFGNTSRQYLRGKKAFSQTPKSKPVDFKENKSLVEKVKGFKLKDIIGKKLNLLMADKLKVQLEDPSKPYNKKTNKYKKMGGSFFPLMDGMFGKVAWASIKEQAANRIIRGAMNGDASVVYNMGDGGIYSNIETANALDEKIPQEKKNQILEFIRFPVSGARFPCCSYKNF